MKKLTIIIAALTVLAGCTTPSNESITDSEAQKEETQIVASFYPLAEFSRQVAGDLADVTTITPAGADPHEYEPTPRQIAQAFDADLFIYNGAGQDPWAEKIAEEVEQKGGKVIEMTEQFTLREEGEDEEHEEEEHEHEHEEEEHEEEEEHGHEEEHAHEKDPHIWLDPTLALKQAEIIRDELAMIDPENEAAYQSNTSQYTNELITLDNRFKEGLANCTKEDIITAHAAFGYMAERYGFNQIAIAGVSTEQEPSARRLAELSTIAKEKEIQYIFFETLVNPRLSEILASEIGAETLVLNPVEGLTKEQEEAGENYVTVMEINLENLQKALECSSEE